MKKFNKIIFRTEFNTIPLCVYDSEQIQNLIVHLFSNSAEARNDATIKVKTFTMENSIFVEIEDNGPGIPKNILYDLFELPIKNKAGYGLFLCKSIIDRHKGEIKFLNREQGTAIQFSLPVL